MRSRKIGGVLLWIFQILVSLCFILIGIGKFRGDFWIRGFLRWGYSDSFRMLIGALEIAGGALLALPQTVAYGAALLISIMIGAVSTLMINHEKLFAPLFWIVVLSLLGAARWRRAWRPPARDAQVRGERV